MTKLEPMSWVSIGLSSPDKGAMWAQVEKQLAAIGFDQSGLILHKPLFDQSFPSESELLGHVVSAEFETRKRMPLVGIVRVQRKANRG